MNFCSKCGAIMLPKKEGNKTYLICANGHKEETKQDVKRIEKIDVKREVHVVEKDFETLPEDNDVECPKCHSKGAYYWTKQMRGGDEPETTFYKCKKCKYTWREN